MVCSLGEISAERIRFVDRESNVSNLEAGVETSELFGVQNVQLSPEQRTVTQGTLDDCGRNEIAGERARREERRKPKGLCSGLQAKSHQRYNWKSNETWN